MVREVRPPNRAIHPCNREMRDYTFVPLSGYLVLRPDELDPNGGFPERDNIILESDIEPVGMPVVLGYKADVRMEQKLGLKRRVPVLYTDTDLECQLAAHNYGKRHMTDADGFVVGGAKVSWNRDEETGEFHQTFVFPVQYYRMKRRESKSDGS